MVKTKTQIHFWLLCAVVECWNEDDPDYVWHSDVDDFRFVWMMANCLKQTNEEEHRSNWLTPLVLAC